LIKALIGHPDWAWGYQDETWWSRLAQPNIHTWEDAGHPLRLVQKTHKKTDPDPKALACYGLLVRWAATSSDINQKVWLRFVEGNPNSNLTIQFMEWVCGELQTAGKKMLVMFWDHASWHTSKMVQEWVDAHNQKARQDRQSIRILVCLLPKKSPWLNPIEPMWMHAKRRVFEPVRKLPAHELAERVCAAFDVPHESHLITVDNVL
jgi:hypothetical protein